MPISFDKEYINSHSQLKS